MAPADDELDAGPRELRAGALRAWLIDGDLRYLRVGHTEVVRRVFVAVRDEAWGTVPGVVTRLRIDQRADGFSASFQVLHRRDGIDFEWRGEVDARATGGAEVTVRYEMSGAPRKDFRTNRTGICVLHPLAGVAGAACRVEHSDGSHRDARFPMLVAPHQPFTDVRGIEYAPAPDVKVRVAFEGEVFETEDQRNWADGSFKTYCRPLDRPFPYRLTEGERVWQRVTVNVRSGDAGAAPEARAHLVLGGPVGRLPRIGVAAPAGPDWERLAALNLAHVRVDLRTASSAEAATQLERAWDLAVRLNVSLEVGLHLGERPDLAALTGPLARFGPRVLRWVVYQDGRTVARPEAVSRVRALLAEANVRGAPVGVGTVGNFAEINRDRGAAETADVVAYLICPQIHATDDWSLVENLDAIGDTVRTARSFTRPAATIAIAPLMLHRRPDPFAKGKSGETEAVVPDPRQRTLFGAGWTLGAVAQLAAGGADVATCYDAFGPFGLMDAEGVFPLYHVLADLGAFAGADVLQVSGSEASGLAALALHLSPRTRTRLMLANLRSERQDLCVSHIAATSARLRRLDDHSIEAATRAPERYRNAPGEHVAIRNGALSVSLAPREVLTVDFNGAEP